MRPERMVAEPIVCKISRSRDFFSYHPPDKFSRIPGLTFSRSGMVVEDDAAILTVLASKDKASLFGIAPAFLAPSGDSRPLEPAELRKRNQGDIHTPTDNQTDPVVDHAKALGIDLADRNNSVLLASHIFHQ